PNVIEVDAENSAGMFLAEDVASGKDIPDSDIAAQDGYAVNVHGGNYYQVRENCDSLDAGEARYIMTGIKLPEGANSVVRIEEAKVIENRLYTAKEPRPWGDVERAGEDVKAGEMLLHRGHLITPYDIPLLLVSGSGKVRVLDVCAGIISIGDELAPYNGVRDSIAPMVRALMPFARTRYAVLRDDLDKIKSTLLEFKDCDIILTAGGSSVGKKDLTKKAITETGTLLFEGVQTNVLKRGGLGLVNGRPVVVMPGRIVSAAVVFNAEGLHVLSKLIGTELRRFAQAELGDDISVKHSMNSTFLFRLSGGVAYPLKWGTGLYSQLAHADAFGYLERNREYKKREKITVQLLLNPGHFLPNNLS
ncbi:MAG: molybdopterin molybdotransferase MoeA, partial [Nitrososphaeria archaeon]